MGIITSRPEIADRTLWIWGGLQKIPYSMNSNNTPTKHRQDCSGFASACMGLPTPGEATCTFLSRGSLARINWDEVEPGDFVGILGPNTCGAAGHIRVVIGTPRTHGVWVIVEQSGGIGPFKRTFNSFGSGYAPYRSTATIRTEPFVVDPNVFPLPNGHYFGDINGPNESHGGYYAAEQPMVKEIQKAIGLSGSDVDGVIGPQTISKIREWQSRVGRPVDGTIDANDWRILFTIVNPTPPVTPTPPVIPDEKIAEILAKLSNIENVLNRVFK